MKSTERNRYRAFSVKYFGPTNSRGSRVKITDLRHNVSKTIAFSYTHHNIQDMAEDYLESAGIKLFGLAMADNDAWLLSEDFETPLK